MENSGTHFIFDGKRIMLSADLREVFVFLQEIDEEIVGILEMNQRAESIRKQYLELLKCAQVQAQKLKENSIEYGFHFTESPSTILKKLKVNQSVRANAIMIFTYLETLLRLNFAYENKIGDGEQVRNLALKEKVWKDFYENYCLSINNQWGQQNQERLKHINALEFRYLRNSLTHFFSVDPSDTGIQLCNSSLDDQARKLECVMNFQAKFLSPENLYDIARGAAVLMIEKWSKDCQSCLVCASEEFNEKISAVKGLINSAAVVLIRGEDIDI